MRLKPQPESVTIDTYRPEYESELCALDSVCEPIRKRLSWAGRHEPFDAQGAFVALQKAKVIGSAALRIMNARVGQEMLSVGYLTDVAVHPEFRRQGLAKTLSEHAIDFAKAHACHGVFLYTDKTSNPGAYALYKTLGFEEVSSVAMMVIGQARNLANFSKSHPEERSDEGFSALKEEDSSLSAQNDTPIERKFLVRPANKADQSEVASLVERTFQRYTFWCPGSVWRFTPAASTIGTGNATYMVESSGRAFGTFGVFHYGRIWHYQMPSGPTPPLLIHHVAKVSEISDRAFWSAIVDFLAPWQKTHPMIGIFVDHKEEERFQGLTRSGFQKLQDGQWYFKSLKPLRAMPQGPVFMGFPL